MKVRKKIPEVEFISKLLRMCLCNFSLQKGLIFWLLNFGTFFYRLLLNMQFFSLELYIVC